MPQTVGMKYLARRIAAYLVDYLCIVCYAALLLLFIIVVVQPEMARDDVGRVAALRLQLVGLITLTLPVVMVFAWMESSRFQATPGKLLLGLRAMSTMGKWLSLPRSFGRNALKFLPWEIAHTGVNQAFVDDHPMPWLGLAISNFALLLVAIYLLTCILGGGRTIYDRIAGARIGS